MKTSDIVTDLFNMQDTAYRDFHSRLVPQIDKESIIGVRTPELRKFSRTFAKSDICQDFLRDVPHSYYEENNLHAFIVADIRDFDTCIKEVDAFLPYMDNWATCDGLRPGCFAKNKDRLLPYVFKWIDDERTYVKRFGIEVLMNHFLDDEFDILFHETVSGIVSDEYYVKMMVAWYFATALAKQFDDTLPYLVKFKLDKWTHNKTIQKAVESFRISAETKEYLKTLRV